MKTKHTPGPWEHLRQGIEIQSEDGNHEVHAFVNGIPVPVCEVYANMHCEHDDPIGEYMISKQEGIANLLLIAAAPELLEALKEIAELNTMYPPNYNTMTEAQKCEWTHYGKFAVIARAAIAKATGE